MTNAQDLGWAGKLVRDEFQLPQAAVTGIKRVKAGPFSLLVHVETAAGNYVVKRFLSDVPVTGFNTHEDACPQRRMMLSATVQRIAGASLSHVSNKVFAPVVHRQDYSTSTMIMDAVNGAVSLEASLLKGDIPTLFCKEFPTALAAFHTDTTKHYDAADPLNNTSKRSLKLCRQYEQTADWIGGSAAMRIREELSTYRTARRCLVHGDLSSRNILLLGDASVILDFGEAHVGDPVFDIANLLSELVISFLCFRRPAQLQRILSFLDLCGGNSIRFDPQSLVTHTATQILCRVRSPGRERRIFDVPEATATRIIQRCKKSLASTQPALADLMDLH